MLRQHSTTFHATVAVQKKGKDWNVLALASSKELQERSGVQRRNVFRTAVPNFSSGFTPEFFLMDIYGPT